MIPWGKLLRSVPVWASTVATMGQQWGDATLALGMTKYLKLIYGFSTANVNIFKLLLQYTNLRKNIIHIIFYYTIKNNFMDLCISA